MTTAEKGYPVMAQKVLDASRPPVTVRIRNLLALAVILLASWLVVRSPLFHRVPPPGVRLTDLRSVGQFQALFNADVGTPRLVLIFSPT
jgi:hypothetical protein